MSFEAVLDQYGPPLVRVGEAMGLSPGAAASAARAGLEASVARNIESAAERFFSALTRLVRNCFEEAVAAEQAKQGLNDGLPAGSASFAEAWEREWDRHLMELALERAKRQTDARQFELFELYAVRRRTPAELGKSHGVSAGNLYVMKHRISERVRRQLANVRSELGFSN